MFLPTDAGSASCIRPPWLDTITPEAPWSTAKTASSPGRRNSMDAHQSRQMSLHVTVGQYPHKSQQSRCFDKRKHGYFNIFNTAQIGSCQYANCRRRQWWKFRQNDNIPDSVLTYRWLSPSPQWEVWWLSQAIVYPPMSASHCKPWKQRRCFFPCSHPDYDNLKSKPSLLIIVEIKPIKVSDNVIYLHGGIP